MAGRLTRSSLRSTPFSSASGKEGKYILLVICRPVICSYPLYAAGEERVDQRSVVGVSRCVVLVLPVVHGGPTHPVIAALDPLLFRQRERGQVHFTGYLPPRNLQLPSLRRRRREGRPAKRSRGESMRGAGIAGRAWRADSPGHRCARPPSLPPAGKRASTFYWLFAAP